MRREIRRLKILCAALAVLAAGMFAWAMVCSIGMESLQTRIAELEAGSTPMPQAAAYDPGEAAAEFKGGMVTVAEASAEYALLKPYYDMLGMNEAEYAGDAKRDVLDGLVEGKILEAKAREYGVYELDDAARAEVEGRVKAEYEEMVAYYMPFRFGDGKSDEEVREEVVAYLKENGYVYEDELQQAIQEAWRDRLYEAVTKDIEVDDVQLRAFYDSQLESAEMIYSANYAEYESDCEAGRAMLWHPEGVRRVQMLVIPFDEAQAAEYADIQALLAAGDAGRLEDLDGLYAALEPAAQEALARAQQGEDFAALMEIYGGTKAEGEHISQRSSIFGEEIREAAMALSGIGDISGIVRSDAGLCILRYASDVKPGAVPFEEVREALKAGCEEEMKFTHFNAAVDGWIAEAEVKYYTERF